VREQQLVLGGREHRDDALDGLRRAGAVDRREDLVPGVGGAKRDLERVDVAQFSDEDDVRVLAQLCRSACSKLGVSCRLRAA
jgi:hypothetical protein